MTEFLDSLKESVLGKEISLPICSLSRKAPIDLFYTYYEGKPRSHRLEFRKLKRTKFEMFLPRYGEDISQLRAAVEGQGYRQAGNEDVFGFWLRLALRLTAGKLISRRDIFSGPSSEMHSRFGEARSTCRYRLAYCRKGAQESIILVSTRHGTQSSTYRKEQRTEFNWLKLSLYEFQIVAKHLDSFMNSREFADVMEREVAELRVANKEMHRTNCDKLGTFLRK